MLTALVSALIAAGPAPGSAPSYTFCRIEAERRGDGPPESLSAICADDFPEAEAVSAAANHALSSVNLDLNRRERFAVAPNMVMERAGDGSWHAAEGQMLIRPMFLVPPNEFLRRPRHYRCDYVVWPGRDGRGEDMEMTCYAGGSTRPSRPARRTMEDFVRSTRWVPTGTRYCFTHSEVGEVDGTDSRGRVIAGEPLDDNLPWPDYCPEG
ncbi:hypothetical protein L5876_14480 [Hyphobacterium sp. SN044]|uniref:hypothetical protein n=1 Tax=Hyphobacterium sp. SN044 TaxID=2912575 RepID=UPI001F1E0D5B|nr:hypothetical protein [Hyphobacterium sp. SN044]MCF8881032.1 hypothetical protein [Hyphobacterium sp. SN044]